MARILRIISIIIIVFGLIIIFFGNTSNISTTLKDNFKSDLLPKTNYTCMEIIPESILIGDEKQYLTTINTNFKNGINIDYGNQNCKRNLNVGDNIHKFSCIAKFYVLDKLKEDGTIVQNSYLVSYDFNFDDRNCSVINTENTMIVGHPNAKILSCKNFSCSWKYLEPSNSFTSPDYKTIKTNIANLVKEI